MGWCRDFGSRISADCDHLMVAGSDSCHCDECGTVCTGRFAACPTVWAQGPQPVVITLTRADKLLEGPTFESRVTNGHPPAEIRLNGTGIDGAGPGLGAGEAALGTVSRPDVLQWLQGAFYALRVEIEGLRGALEEEKALVRSLLESHAQDRIDPEALRNLVAAAAQQAVQDETADLKMVLRTDLGKMRRSQDERVTSLSVELDERDSVNRRAFRTTMHEELQPLVDIVAESVAQSEVQLGALDRTFDKFKDMGADLFSALAQGLARMDALGGHEEKPADEADAAYDRLGLLQRARGSAEVPRKVTLPRSDDRPGAAAHGRTSTGERVSLRRSTHDS